MYFHWPSFRFRARVRAASLKQREGQPHGDVHRRLCFRARVRAASLKPPALAASRAGPIVSARACVRPH